MISICLILRPDATVPITPMEEGPPEVVQENVVDDTADVVAEKSGTAPSEVELAPPAVQKEINLKREVKQQIREESMNQQEEGYYEVLSANEYLGIDPVSVKSSLTHWCKCPMPPKGQSGCLAECENRVKKVECDLPLCKAGDQCSNRVSQL